MRKMIGKNGKMKIQMRKKNQMWKNFNTCIDSHYPYYYVPKLNVHRLFFYAHYFRIRQFKHLECNIFMLLGILEVLDLAMFNILHLTLKRCATYLGSTGDHATLVRLEPFRTLIQLITQGRSLMHFSGKM